MLVKVSAPILQDHSLDGWRKLPPAELEALINKIRRSAVERHLSAAEWRQLDRMRKRYLALQKQEIALGARSAVRPDAARTVAAGSARVVRNEQTGAAHG